MKGLLVRYRRGIEPDTASVARVAARVEEADARLRGLRGALAPLTRTDEVGVARVRTRLATGSRAALAFPAWIALAALGVLVVAWPRSAPAPLDLRLASPDRVEMALTPLVHVTFRGGGSVEGTARAPVIRWEDGTIDVEVEPGEGIALVVDTPDARVAVVGTVFRVTRDARGTEVSVTRGKVEVTCVRGDHATLTAGNRTTCLPERPAGLLGRAQALLQEGGVDDALQTLDLGLATAEPGPVRDELLALRAVTRARLGRDAEARADADAYLAGGTSLRRAAVARLAAQLSMRVGDCPSVRRYLDAIPQADRLPTDPVDCVSP